METDKAMKLKTSEVFYGADAKATTALYGELEGHGPIGLVAMNLLRASKKSRMAKVYRGGDKRGSYKNQAYEQKNWAINQLCALLSTHGRDLGIRWGWKRDEAVHLIGDSSRPSWVLYVEVICLPDMVCEPSTEQVSYHATGRGTGPDYDGEWDGIMGVSDERAIAFADYVRSGAYKTARAKTGAAV